jgi:uncharacterized protein (TIGR00304 family)
MRKSHISISFLLSLGILLLLISVLKGELSVGFLFIFPFIYGRGLCASLGILLIFISIVLFIFSLFNFERVILPAGKNSYDKKVEQKKSVEGGGIILIGPIPIVFGSNWKIAIFLIILAIILITITAILFYF